MDMGYYGADRELTGGDWEALAKQLRADAAKLLRELKTMENFPGYRRARLERQRRELELAAPDPKASMPAPRI